uniref:Uncharacterized protein n=1 Tax=Arundo donax TaxID=35708 RepID=A0A0A9IV02_ARUDO
MRDASRGSRTMELDRNTAQGSILTTGHASTSVSRQSSLIGSSDDGMLLLMCGLFQRYPFSVLNFNKSIHCLASSFIC